MSGRELVGRRPSGTSSGAGMWVSKPWVSSGERLHEDRAATGSPVLQCYSRLQTPDRLLQHGGDRSAPPGTRTSTLWRRCIACVSHQRHGDHCCMPHTLLRLIHGERNSSTPQGSVGLPDLASAVQDVVVSDFPRHDVEQAAKRLVLATLPRASKKRG